MNCLIVDDNKIARITLRKMVSLDPSLVLVGECPDATDAYQKILQQPIDLIFLDVEMPGMSGIELVKSLGQHQPLIIFTTSKKEYAAEAFDLQVADYITKPVTPVRFLQAVEKAKASFKKKTTTTSSPAGNEFIFIRDSNVVRRLKAMDILFLEAKGDYVQIFTEEKQYSIHATLKSVEEKLSADLFLRIHRSFIINVGKIDTLEGKTIIIHKHVIPVSDAYRSLLNNRMQIL